MAARKRSTRGSAAPVNYGTPAAADFEIEEDSMRPSKKRSKTKAAGETTFEAPPVRKARTKKATAGSITEQDNRPEPCAEPEIWADKRQQFCETLPWHKQHQASASTKDGKVFGFMSDGGSGPRDIFAEEYIICSIGGGKEEDDSGKRVFKKDQIIDHKDAIAFRGSMEDRQAVGFIIGQKNQRIAVKIPHYYCVLGWFQITDVWYDKYDFKSWMIRAEKIDLHTQSWWAPKDAKFAPPQFPYITVPVQTCTTCNEESKQIYTEGWVCLNPSCKRHFVFEKDVNLKDLHFDEAFLQQRTEFSGEIPGDFGAGVPTSEDIASGKIRFKKGFVCPRCGCCSRRRRWMVYECENDGCDFSQPAVQTFMTVQQALVPPSNPSSKLSSKPSRNSVTIRRGGVQHYHFRSGAYTVDNYVIPGVNGEAIGFVNVFGSTAAINRQADGPDDLFELMQKGEFDLKRNSARGGNATQQVLTSHFARNFGANYKFGVVQESEGFNTASDVILKILKRTDWATHRAIDGAGESFGAYQPSNELLCLSYGADCSIGYHDDGEKTLGPTVTSLSLGGGALMLFRPKGKSPIGVPSNNAKGTKPPILSFHLSHGDIMVMHGPEIQKHYEHSVEPYGTLRFALTARTILIEKMPENEQEHAKIAGAIPARAEQYVYDGDVHLVNNSGLTISPPPASPTITIPPATPVAGPVINPAAAYNAALAAAAASVRESIASNHEARIALVKASDTAVDASASADT